VRGAVGLVGCVRWLGVQERHLNFIKITVS